MTFTYPGAKGGAPWSPGWPPGMGSPTPHWGKPSAYPFPSPWAKGPSPYAGKGLPYGQPGKYPPPAYSPRPLLSPTTPPPPAYMGKMFPPAPPYGDTEGLGSMVIDLAAVIGPALSGVMPAIQGLLQIPAMLLEVTESAGLLRRWDELHATLLPGPGGEYLSGSSSGELSPGVLSPGEWSPGELSPGELSPGDLTPGEEEIPRGEA